MVPRTILIATFLVMAFGASSASALLVSAKPAWNGWVRAKMPTEVAIRVVGDRGGLLTLTLTDRSVSYTHQANLEPDTEFVWRVPLSPASGEPLQLYAQLDEEPRIEQELTFRIHLAPSPLVAVVAGQAIPLDRIQATTIHVSGNSVPFHYSGFAAMDLIVIHRDSLKGMARQQLIALQQHAAQCGRIVIVGFASAAMARFTKLAGCGGRFLVAVETLTDLDTRVASLLEARAPHLPSPGSMRSLLDNNGMSHHIPSLIAFFTIYLCVLLIAARSQRAPLYISSASIAATLIGLVAWTMNSEYIDRVTWTEMESSAGVARFTSILRVLGDGGKVAIDIPLNAGPLQALQPINLTFASAYNGDGAASMSFDTRLFSQHEFITSGATTLPVPLTVEYSGDAPHITNTGTGKSPPALLVWNDLKYSVPPLTSDEDWRPSSRPEPWGTSRAEKLFRQRAMHETMALLFEFSTSGQQPADTARNYLMVRP